MTIQTDTGLLASCFPVSSADEVQKVIKDVFADFGRIDVLVANAGMAVSQPLLDQSLEDYRKQMSVNGEPKEHSSRTMKNRKCNCSFSASHIPPLQSMVWSTAPSLWERSSRSRASETSSSPLVCPHTSSTCQSTSL